MYRRVPAFRPHWVLIALMAACQQGPAPDRIAGDQQRPAPDPIAADQQTPGPKPIAADQQAPPPDPVAGDQRQTSAPARLTPDGWGELRIGMTLREVVSVAGEDADPEAFGGPDPERCDQFRPTRAPDGMLVMMEQGRLTRISISAGADVETEAGIEVGDSVSAVRAGHGSGVESTPHQYWPAPAEYLTVWSVEPPAADAKGLVYEVDEDGRVVHIHAGGPSIRRVEGCI